MRLAFLTPLAALVALASLAPLAALLHMRARARGVRAALGLAEPGGRLSLPPAAALALAGALLGLAAAQPVLEGATTRRVRTDAEAFFVLDTSRSMLARRAPGAPSRLARAKAVAEEVRRALPDVRAGLASITDRTLPHLFPSADEDVFRATLARAIGVDRPPPVHRLLARATQLEALADVPRQEFFSPSARARLLVVLTDGETLAGSGLRLGPLFRRPPAIGTVFVHVWGRDERVYAGGVAEPGYRADPAARATLERLAREVGGRVLAESEAGAAAGLARELLGRGPTVARGLRSWRVPLAPYLVAAGLLPLAVLLVRRGR